MSLFCFPLRLSQFLGGAPLHTVTSFVYVTSAFSADVFFVCSRFVCLLPCIALTVQLYPSLLDPLLVNPLLYIHPSYIFLLA
jgi:hypothetical protein